MSKRIVSIIPCCITLLLLGRLLAGTATTLEATPAATAATQSTTLANDATQPAPIQVEVQPSLTVQVESVAQVPNIFGATVNGSAFKGADDMVRALNLNSARAYVWPMYYDSKHVPPGVTIPPVTPGTAAQYGHGGSAPLLTRQEISDVYDRFYAQDFPALMEQWWTTSSGPGSEAFQTELFSRWGLTHNLIFHTQLDGSALTHEDGVNRYYSAYLDTLHRHCPDLSLDYVQLTNEPNYPWFSWQFDSQRAAADAWVTMFNRLDDYLRQHYPQTHLLGPCLACETFFSWRGWWNWTVPVLKGVEHPMTDFNYHCYDVPAYEHLAWLEMLQAQAEVLGRPRPRAVITEMSFGLNAASPKANRARVRWWAEQLLMGLRNPDKANIFNYFLLAYPPFDGNNLLHSAKGKWIPNDAYWLYWTLANLRGRPVYVAPPDDSQLQVFATAPSPQTMVVVAFNESAQTRPVQIHIALPEGAKVDQLSSRFAKYEDLENPIEHGEQAVEISKTDPGSVTAVLAPGEVRTWQWNLSQPLTPSGTMEQREFYSATVAQAFDHDLPLNIKVPRLPDSSEATTLRLGVSTDAVLAARGLKVIFNGQSRTIYWNQTPGGEQGQHTVWWLELPVENSQVKADNEVVMSEPDAAYNLMFASLVYQQHPSATEAQAAGAQLRTRVLTRVQAALTPMGSMMAGDHQRLAFAVNNPDTRSHHYQVSLLLPPELHLADGPSSWEFDVPAGEQHAINGIIEAQAALERPMDTVLQMPVQSPGLIERDLRQQVTVYPRRVIPALSTPPQIDDKLADWVGQPLSTVDAPGLHGKFWIAWDPQYLYLAADVSGDFKAEAPPSIGNFWSKDGLELFVDASDQKHREYDEDAIQLFLCPVGLQGGPAFAGHVVRQRHGDSMDETGTVADPDIRVVSNVTDQGYQLEAAIPRKLLNGSDKWMPGKRIGLNLALDHPKGANSPGFGSSVMGLNGKFNGSPATWPDVLLQ